MSAQPNRNAVVVDVRQLPSAIARQRERLITETQQLTAEMDALAADIARHPDDRARQSKWRLKLQLLSDLNSIIDLLEVPMVRLIASEQQRQRHTMARAAMNN